MGVGGSRRRAAESEAESWDDVVPIGWRSESAAAAASSSSTSLFPPQDDSGPAAPRGLGEPLLEPHGEDDGVALCGVLVDGRASSIGTGINITNNVIGAGMLSLPFVLREASFTLGLGIILTVCSLAGASFYMLACCCELSGHADYRRIGTAAFGPGMGRVIQATVLCYTALACISFCVLLGDLAPDVIANLTNGAGPIFHLLGSRYTVLPAIGLLVLLPMSCMRDLRHFQHSSAFALCCDAIAATIIVSHFFLPSDQPPRAGMEVNETVNWDHPGVAALTTVPIVVVAANSHYNAPRYYAELKGRSTQKIAGVVVCALGLCLAVYVTVAACGYMQFGEATKGDIFLNYGAANDVTATIGRAALAIHLAMTFPLIFHACRLGVHNLFFAVGGEASDLTSKQAILYTVVMVPPLVAIGTLIPEISVVFAFNGSLFGALIVYIFPALMYAKLTRVQEARGLCPAPGVLWSTVLPGVIASAGVFLMLTGATVTALQKLHVL